MPQTTIAFAVNDQQARAAFDDLQRELRETESELQRTNRAARDTHGRFVDAGRGADVFTRSLDGARGLLTGFGAAVAARELIEFGAASGQAAGEMEGLQQALEAIVGENATQRLRDFNEIAKLPELNTPEIIRFTQATANHTSELEKLKAAAEETRRVFTDSESQQQLTPNFQAALAASNAYYAERIRHAETTLAKEKEGTDAFNALQVEILQLGRQQVAAQRTLETERTNILRTYTQERVRIEQNANNAVSTGMLAVVRAGREALQARVEFAQQLAAIPRASSPDAQYGRFTEHLRADFQETAQHGRSLLDVMRQVADFTLTPLDLNAEIPDPVNREIRIDERIATAARDPQARNDTRQDTRDQGLLDEERAVQTSLRKQARSYRQFANLVSNTFINLATGRAENFEQVATAFLQQSLRIVLRAYVEFQVQKKLDDDLTASKIENLRRVAAAQQTGGLAGNLPGLANLPGIGNLGGNLLSGGAGALGVAGLLFPNESSNLLSGIKNEISGFLSNVAEVPDRAFGAQQVYLKLGEGEIRDITDIQDELREEQRV